jgi:hypothetical protein
MMVVVGADAHKRTQIGSDFPRVERLAEYFSDIATPNHTTRTKPSRPVAA